MVSFCCTYKVLLSPFLHEFGIVVADIVFLRSWYPVTVPQLYNPVTSLLMPVGEKDCWTGMRTLGQLKQDLNIHNMPNKDCLYKVKQPLQAQVTYICSS